MPTIEPISIDDLADNFELLGDWEERIQYLMDLGRKLPLAEWFMKLQAPADPAVVAAYIAESPAAFTEEQKRNLPLLFSPDHLVKGCQATVFMRPRVATNGQRVLSFDAVANAGIVNGLIAVLKAIYDGRTPRQVLDTDAAAILARLQIEQHISPTRRNGLHAMLTRIRQIAAENA